MKNIHYNIYLDCKEPPDCFDTVLKCVTNATEDTAILKHLAMHISKNTLVVHKN